MNTSLRWGNERSFQGVSEDLQEIDSFRTKNVDYNFRHCSNRIDFTLFRLVFRPTLVVKIKKAGIHSYH
jgi:hypothetical protein